MLTFASVMLVKEYMLFIPHKNKFINYVTLYMDYTVYLDKEYK